MAIPKRYSLIRVKRQLFFGVSDNYNPPWPWWFFLPRVLPLSSAARQGQYTRASRNVRPLFDLYAWGNGASMGPAALDFFACSTR